MIRSSLNKIRGKSTVLTRTKLRSALIQVQLNDDVLEQHAQQLQCYNATGWHSILDMLESYTELSPYLSPLSANSIISWEFGSLLSGEEL